MDLEPATLTGFEPRLVAGADYPVLCGKEGCRIGGGLTAPLSAREVVALRLYEGPEYDEAALPVDLPDGRRVVALVFVNSGRLPVTDQVWSLEGWRRR